MSEQTAPASTAAAPGNGTVTATIVAALRGTRPWVLLIGILLMIGAVFMGIASLIMLLGGGMVGHMFGRAGGGAMMAMGVPYLLFTLLYGFLARHLLSYAGAIESLAKNAVVGELERALEAQRRFWKLAGIVALAGIVMAVLGIIAAIAIPLMLR